MKKTYFAIAITFLVTGLLFASQSWIGIQGTGSYKMESTTYTILGLETEEEHTTMLAGMNIAGTIYPGQSPIGIGIEVGFAKVMKATRGSSDVDVEDFPLTWKGGVTGEYYIPLTKMLALELGAGLSYERTIKIFDIGGSSDIETTLNILNALLSTNLVAQLSDSLAIVGGIQASFPLATQAKFELGSISYSESFNGKGFAINGKVGVAFSL